MTQVGANIIRANAAKRKGQIDERANLTAEEYGLRTDLRNQVVELRQRLEECLKEQDEWRNRYYMSVSETLSLTAKCNRLQIENEEVRKECEEIKAEHAGLEERYTQLHLAYNSLFERTDALSKKIDQWLGEQK